MTVFTYKERVADFAASLDRLIEEALLHLAGGDLVKVLQDAAQREAAKPVS